MRAIGVKELRDNMSRILQEVADRREEISITNHGKEMARLVPPRRAVTREELAGLWRDIDRTAQEISALWPDGVSAVDAVREDRE